ncbi:MAG: hypothetical protein J2P31_08975 [Blastocatellia bacterium]|nr:hypothetical protein [Blastocatellia bacterium]
MAVQTNEVAEHFAALPKAQRQAISLVALDGKSYEKAALEAGVCCDTMKSRVSRGRTALVIAATATRSGDDHSAEEGFFSYRSVSSR